MLETFLIKPFLAVIFATISCSLLGVFMLWRKLSYFGDALAHAILLGLALGAIFETSQLATLIFFAVIFAFLVSLVAQSRYFSKDSVIMITSYCCVALAVILSNIRLQNFQITSYIFGDVLTAGNHEVKALSLIALLTIFYAIFSFKKILLSNVNRDLAQIEGVKTELWNLSFLILLAVAIALSVRIVGIFLMTALLVLPAAIARIFSVSARQMMLLSLIFGIVVSATSFKLASLYDLTVGPAIILIFSLIFFCSLLLKKLC